MNTAQAIKPHLRIGLWLVICAIAVNAALQVLAHTPVLGWVPQKISGTGFIEDSRDRVAGAAREIASAKPGSDNCLTVIMGLSDVREGTDLGLIKDRLQVPCHLMALTGAGGRVEDIAPHLSALLESPLKPTLAVIGFAPALLLDEQVSRPKRGDSEASEGRIPTLRELAIAARNWFWVYSRRTDLRLTVEERLLDFRHDLFRTFRVQANDGSVEKRSPWRGTIRLMGGDKYSEATLQKDLQWFESLGAFDADAYKASSIQSGILKDMISGLRQRGAAVLLVLTPEHSRLRMRIPIAASQAVSSLLSQIADTGVSLVDLRTLLDDSDFVDLKHPNNHGSELISAALAGEIQKRLSVQQSKAQN